MDEEPGNENGLDEAEPPLETPLKFWNRVALFCLSAFFLTVGIGSVFRTDNEGATAALVIGGMAVALVAVLGEVPAKGSIGGVAWDLQKRLLRSSNRKVAEEAAEGVLDAATISGQVPPPIVASARLSLQRVSLDYYHEVRSALFRVAYGMSGLSVDTGVREADALLRYGDQVVLVEVKLRLQRGPVDLVSHLRMVARRLQESSKVPIHGVLLVTPRMTPKQIEFVESGLAELKVKIALWEGEADDSALAQQIRSLLSQESQTPYVDGPPPTL